MPESLIKFSHTTRLACQLIVTTVDRCRESAHSHFIIINTFIAGWFMQMKEQIHNQMAGYLLVPVCHWLRLQMYIWMSFISIVSRCRLFYERSFTISSVQRFVSQSIRLVYWLRATDKSVTNSSRMTTPCKTHTHTIGTTKFCTTPNGKQYWNNFFYRLTHAHVISNDTCTTFIYIFINLFMNSYDFSLIHSDRCCRQCLANCAIIYVLHISRVLSRSRKFQFLLMVWKYQIGQFDILSLSFFLSIIGQSAHEFKPMCKET